MSIVPRRTVYTTGSLYRSVFLYKTILTQKGFDLNSAIAIPPNISPYMIVNNGCKPSEKECVHLGNCICYRAFGDGRLPVAISVDWRQPGVAFEIANITGNGLFLCGSRLIQMDLNTMDVESWEDVDIECV